MITVKTLIAHSNGFGETFAKDAGDSYDLPEADAAGLIAEGLIEPVPVKAEKPAKQGGDA